MSIFSPDYSPIDADGFTDITPTNSVLKLSENTIPPNASKARIQVTKQAGSFATETEIIRYNFSDSVPPNTSLGHVLGHLDYIELTNKEQIDAFQFTTAETNVYGLVSIQYFRD